MWILIKKFGWKRHSWNGLRWKFHAKYFVVNTFVIKTWNHNLYSLLSFEYANNIYFQTYSINLYEIKTVLSRPVFECLPYESLVYEYNCYIVSKYIVLSKENKGLLLSSEYSFWVPQNAAASLTLLPLQTKHPFIWGPFASQIRRIWPLDFQYILLQ